MAEYMDIHAPTQTPDQPQVDTENKDVRFVLTLYEEGKEAKKEFSEKWEEYRNFYKSRQYKYRLTSGKADAVYNVCRSTIQSTIPILTDSKPGFNIGPKEPRDYLFADNLTKVCEDIWEKRGCDHTIVEALMDSQIVSAGICKVTWNQKLEQGLGDVDVQCVNPDDIFIPKYAVDFDKNCAWVIHRCTKRIGEVRKLFSLPPGLVHTDGNYKQDEYQKKMLGSEVNIVSPVDKKSNLPAPYAPAPGDEKMVDVIECWLDSESLDEYEEYFEAGSETPAGWKKKFPNGKLITILPEQKILLQAVENPYKHGKFPFVRFVDTIMPRQFWGEGEIEPLMPVQRMVNKCLATIMDWLNMYANAPWLIPTNCGVDIDKITNAIALIIPYTPGPNGEKPERMFPQELPSYVFDVLQTLLRMAESISGIQEVTQGRRPTGITAAEAISTLQEAAQTRIRLKERNLSVSLTQMAELFVGLVLQFYTTPRVVKITGAAEWPEFFEFHVKDLENGQYQYIQQPYTFDPATHQYAQGVPVPSEPSKGLFDIKVLAGTALPMQKAEKGNLAIKLAEMGIIDREEVLNTLEWKNKEEVNRRMDEKEAMAAQQQAQMAMAPPPKG